ncbi:MAG: hypothetical protein RLZZ175_2967 [Bacteroidota bacterium]|jgi:thiol peroxidase
MSNVTFKGNAVSLAGSLPANNSTAPDFTVVKSDLSEVSLSNFEGKVKVLIAVPSIDTGVCAAEARAFNTKLNNKENVVGLVISKDLPFAQKRFCEAEGLANIVTGSDFRYGQFAQQYGTLMLDGPLKGLSARVIFIVDKNNKIAYTQVITEITTEPDYDAVLAEIDKLV